MVQPATTGAFTLIEVLISAALMALILVSAYLCLDAAFQGRKIVEPRADIFQNARVAMAMMTADLRAACALPGDSPFLGMQRTVGHMEADNLDFATHNYTPRHASEGDFCEVSYYVDQDPHTGRFSLWRRRNPTLAPDPLAGGRQEEIAQNISGIQFEYSDGLDWYDSWGAVKGLDKAESSQRQQSNLGGMPEAVRITLMMDSDPQAKVDAQTNQDMSMSPPPLVFQTVARLNLTDAAQNNSSGASAGSSDDNGNNNGGQSGPGSGGGSP